MKWTKQHSTPPHQMESNITFIKLPLEGAYPARRKDALARCLSLRLNSESNCESRNITIELAETSQRLCHLLPRKASLPRYRFLPLQGPSVRGSVIHL